MAGGSVTWLRSLLSSTDASADSVIVGGLFALASMTGIYGFVVIWRGQVFSATEYAMAAAGLIAAIAGSKRLRDGATDGAK